MRCFFVATVFRMLWLLAGVFLSSFSVMAAVDDGNAFMEHCAAVDKVVDAEKGATDVESFGAALCMGYVAGAYDMMGVARSSFSAICIPRDAEISRFQVIRILVAFMEKNPKYLHEPVGLIFIRAMKDAYPC
jgi:hypothetical protein